MTRTLPWGMHYKECRILVEAAMMYYPKMVVGQAVVALWTMPVELANMIRGLNSHLEVTDAILTYQDQ